jgi:hypothetical protein
MTDWTLVSLETAPPQPWRNGGGVTRELLAWPNASDWTVRLSVADVAEDGPFSRFENVERWFAVIDGAGVVLRIGGGAQRLGPDSEAFRFDGALASDCSLVGGPTLDFNLMAPPGTSALRRVRGEEIVRSAAGGVIAVYAHSRPARVVIDWRLQEVPAYHLAWCLRDAPTLGIVNGDDALWMEART